MNTNGHESLWMEEECRVNRPVMPDSMVIFESIGVYSWLDLM